MPDRAWIHDDDEGTPCDHEPVIVVPFATGRICGEGRDVIPDPVTPWANPDHDVLGDLRRMHDEGGPGYGSP